jgi:ATP-dependent Clp protease protease subunit
MTEQNTNKETEAKNKIAEDNKNREFLLNKNVSSDSVEAIVKGIFEINRYDDKQEEIDSAYVRRPIKITVDSFGGSIYCGLLLVNAIENSDTPIHGYCYSKAMSMGFITFVVCHKRFASPNAT